MTLPLSAADVLGEHVAFELECIDRVYCNAYARKLTYPGGVASFFTKHRGATFASTCLADPISKQFVASIQRFAAEHEIEVVRFEKGQRKDDVALERLAGFDQPEGIYMVGVAQEKVSTFRTEKRRNPETGATYPWIVRASAVVNQYYMYGLDVDFGPFFVKFSSYFPYGAKLCFNGHHWAQRQAQQAGIAFTALDNGFLECDHPEALQRVCDRLSPAKIDAFFRRWLARLPHPFTGADRRAGYRYELSRRRTAVRRPSRDGAAVAATRLQPVRAGFHQPRAEIAARAPAGTPPRCHDRRTGHLRPTATTRPRSDPAHPPHQPLPPHRRRPQGRARAHPNPHQTAHPSHGGREQPNRGPPPPTPSSRQRPNGS